jgi:hypothetical protein
VRFLLVGVGDTPEDARAFVTANGVTDIDLAHAPEMAPLRTSLGVAGVPTLYVISRRSRLEFVHLGVPAGGPTAVVSALSGELDALLSEAAER